VYDANHFATVRIGPARDVAGGQDLRHAGFEPGVHGDSAIDGQSGAFREFDPRPYADAHDHEIGRDRAAVPKFYLVPSIAVAMLSR
jgi:hypothetical protein